ncbi:uncharacterized protein MYCFIDRAFT_211778, partial [Pseudocercospora fijiensis CIRAD86]
YAINTPNQYTRLTTKAPLTRQTNTLVQQQKPLSPLKTTASDQESYLTTYVCISRDAFPQGNLLLRSRHPRCRHCIPRERRCLYYEQSGQPQLQERRWREALLSPGCGILLVLSLRRDKLKDGIRAGRSGGG